MVGNLDFPNIKKLKKFVLMSKPAQKCENNAIFKQNYITSTTGVNVMIYEA